MLSFLDVAFLHTIFTEYVLKSIDGSVRKFAVSMKNGGISIFYIIEVISLVSS